MIDVGNLLNDIDLAQPFAVWRSWGTFVAGGYQPNQSQIDMYGIVEVANAEDLDQVPEGDRLTGAMAFYSNQQLFATSQAPGFGEESSEQVSGEEAPYGSRSGVSDVLMWRGNRYRVVSVFPFTDWGYWKAIAVRMAGS